MKQDSAAEGFEIRSSAMVTALLSRLLFPKATDKFAQAGLLTYSIFSRLPVVQQWLVVKTIKELTASGNVRDLHPVPF